MLGKKFLEEWLHFITQDCLDIVLFAMSSWSIYNDIGARVFRGDTFVWQISNR